MERENLALQFDTDLAERPRPLVIAHRGDSAHAPENTLAAFELALRKGAHAIELDAKLTADGAVVVIHDQSLERTTDGRGAVAAQPLAALQELDAGAKFAPEFAGERIPTLGEVFELVGRRAIVDVELTNYADAGSPLPERVVELVQRYGMEKRVFFTSFHPLLLRRARRLAPQIPAGLLAMEGLPGRLARSWIGELAPHEIFIPNAREASRALVDSTHRRGKLIYFYNVNAADEMRRLAEYGADAIISDDPALALEVVN